MKILWIVLVWPEPDSSAAGLRTMQLIEALRAAGHEVQLSSPCRTNDHRTRLTEQGIETVSFPPNDTAFDAFLSGFNPDVVFFDRFMAEEQFGWRVRAQCPAAVRILDTVDLHSLRRARERSVTAGRSPLELSAADLSSEDAIRELSAIYRSDLSLVVSDVELKLLQDHYGVPAELLSLTQIFYPATETLLDFDSRRNFVTIGNFNHKPNADSYRTLHQDLWPRIRSRLRDGGADPCELHIYGAYPTSEFLSLDDAASGFRVKGWAENSTQTLAQYRVNLAPLRFGAGIKGKVAEGWAAGTPCVGTSIAAEGLHSALPFGGAVADDWDCFAEQAAALYTDRGRWEAAQQQGAQIIQQCFDPQAISSRFIREIELLVEQISAARLRNFTGAMLWHHQHRSTEFFSRWIEIKNKV